MAIFFPLLDLIACHSPLVEVGAGTGYWSHLLGQRGADVIAYDQAPLGGERPNRYHFDLWPWTDVHRGDSAVLQQHPTRARFICWPPLYSALWDVLRFFSGERVIYVGDGGHKTARLAGLDDDFDEVERWEVTAMDPDPSAQAYLSVWTRKTRKRRFVTEPY